MSFVSSSPPCALTSEPLSGQAHDRPAAWLDMQDADLWPRALRLGLIGVLSLASWGLLLGVACGLRSALG